MDPQISIIIPVYKVEKYLSKCIDSILSQTFTNYELLLIDDGSPDNSGKICDNYSRLDNRIKTFHQINKGVSAARNYGLQKATGKWVTFIDADDWISETYLSDLYNDIITDDMLIFHDLHGNGSSLLENRTVKNEEMGKYFISNKLMYKSGPVSKLYNMEIIRSYGITFPINIHMGEDAIFILRYLNRISTLKTSTKNNYYARMHTGSLTTRFFSFESEWNCYQIWKSELYTFITKYGINIYSNPKQVVWDNRIGDTFIRCLQSLIRNGEKLSIKQKIKILKEIPLVDYNEFIKYYHPKDLKRKIITYILKRRLFYIFFFLENLYLILKNKQK